MSTWVSDREARRMFAHRFGTRVAQLLARAGYRGLEHVRRTADEDLLAERNLGPTTLALIRAVVGDPPPGSDAEPPADPNPPAWMVIA